MSYNTVASSLANTSYLNNIEYLDLYWSEKEIVRFIKKTEAIISVLKEAPKTFKTWHVDTTIHCIEIEKQITLYYEIQENTVYLLLFFTNHQNPEKLQELLLG
ncbi:hypothetical protein [Jejuia pallidilutea]|uniref:Plasmid stabilization system protein ParE n=1 Tax=Jejuia pallidilutea TaxID=504487 RepID=A0A090VZH8_9FLAO|nr:hypothetical protein [Jejuia pallidilutea]GAL65491.1 hypothetical protein JCM19301_3951 [Jejuia pallidilutea]GAL70051.1 hypothetical protein JCM19302_2626 [Jejuia pallidilutea]GAL88960.1 hypothetical protein JCM19538_1949 [Jejuia pallidilutea]